MILPKHECSITISHNSHKELYEQTADVVLESDCVWVSDEERRLAVERDSIWEIRLYDKTPVGFYHIAASSLSALLEYCNRNFDTDEFD